MLDKIDFEETNDRGSIFLGSLPVQVAGDPEKRVILYFPVSTPTDKAEALLAAVCRACVPLPQDRTLAELAKVAVLCKSRALDEDEQTLSMTAMLEKLAEYPADAVLWALQTWPEHNHWQPSWFELKRLIMAHAWGRVRVRNNLTVALQKRRERVNTAANSQ